MKRYLPVARNTLVNASTACFLTLVSAFVNAAPTITATSAEETADGRILVTVQGSGFGTKEQAAPVLVDYVDKSYEYGKLNDAYSKLGHGDKVPATTDGEPSIWAAVSSGAWGSVPPYINSTQPPRHQSSSEHYLLTGHNSTLGNPVAYGGLSGWDTPKDNHQLYVSWWYKPAYTPSRYWRISPIDYQGTFEEGETLNVGGLVTATFIGQDPEGQLNIQFNEKPPVTSDLKGSRISGEQSGASATFPSDPVSSSEEGYETPGSQKYIRVWEDPYGKEGLRFSWTQMHQTISSRGDISGLVNWEAADIEGGEWHHLEVAVDTALGKIELSVNASVLTTLNFDPRLSMESQYSPTVALLGLNGKVGKLQEGLLDDIYIDSTLQRVVLANAKTASEVTHYELQRPIKWTPTTVTFSLNEGSLTNFESSYVYVYGKDGNVNAEGIAVCQTCKAPPDQVKLEVK